MCPLLQPSSISGAAVVPVGSCPQPGRGALSAVAFPFNLYFLPSWHERHMGNINFDFSLTQIFHIYAAFLELLHLSWSCFFGKAFGVRWKEIKITQDFFLEANSMHKTLRVGFPVNYRPQQLVSWDEASPCSVQTTPLASRGSEEGLFHQLAKTRSVMGPVSSRLDRCFWKVDT